jgi:muconolactone delta-isomerase
MSTIARVAERMQAVLFAAANRLAIELGFVKRIRKITGSLYAQALVFAVLSHPKTTYTDLVQNAATVGLEISAQGMEQRFTQEAASFMQYLLAEAVQQVIATRPAAVPLLQRFQGVYLRDSTVISLPVALAQTWPGVGGSKGATAALKLQVELDLSRGELRGPIPQSGRTQDQRSPFQQRKLPIGALHLADLGFYNLHRLATDQLDGVFWITRLKTGTALYTPEGQRIDLLAWLSAHPEAEFEQAVLVGARERIPARLLVQRVPQEVADQRRRRTHEYARKKQVMPKAETLALADWTLVITNVPVERLSLAEALVLSAVRWQIELLFKLWKSYLRVDEWRSQNPWRILCETYAKLIGAVMVHWLSLVGAWERVDRSLPKVAQAVCKFAASLAMALPDREELIETLTRLQKCIQATCKMNHRKKHPNTYQTLLEVP